MLNPVTIKGHNFAFSSSPMGEGAPLWSWVVIAQVAAKRGQLSVIIVGCCKNNSRIIPNLHTWAYIHTPWHTHTHRHTPTDTQTHTLMDKDTHSVRQFTTLVVIGINRIKSFAGAHSAYCPTTSYHLRLSTIIYNFGYPQTTPNINGFCCAEKLPGARYPISWSWTN